MIFDPGVRIYGIEIAIPPIGEDSDRDCALRYRWPHTLDRHQYAARRAAGQDRLAARQFATACDTFQICDVEDPIRKIGLIKWRTNCRSVPGIKRLARFPPKITLPTASTAIILVGNFSLRTYSAQPRKAPQVLVAQNK
jgi:hypothetical protein